MAQSRRLAKTAEWNTTQAMDSTENKPGSVPEETGGQKSSLDPVHDATNTYNYYDDYGYDDSCGWQWVKVKKWNYSHTHFWIVKKKVWTCY